jgi:hypothetical protein
MADPVRHFSNFVLDSSAQESDSSFLPVLVDIRHSGIYWGPDAGGETSQENGHLRLVNDVRGVKYKGDDPVPYWYAPCTFSFKPGKDDGKNKANASITISAADSRIIEVIRSIEEDLVCQVVALYGKVKNDEGRVSYTFTKVYGKEFDMTSVNWDGISAQFTLNPDSTLDMNTPRDKGSLFRFPSITVKV